jgi:integrase
MGNDERKSRQTGFNVLTDAAIRNAKPRDKNYKLTDGRGLYLLVTDAGVKLWRLDYSFAGKRKTLAIGQFPDVGLAGARGARDEARSGLAKMPPIDPNETKRLVKAALLEKHTNTFKVIALEWQNKTAPSRKANTESKLTRWLEKDIFPHLGNRPISAITAKEVKDMIQPLAERGVYDTAKRVRWIVSQIFDFAIVEDACTGNPAKSVLMGNHFAKLKAATKTQSHAAIINPVELGGLLRAIDGYQGTATVGAALKLAPMLFVRPGELRHAEWAEVDWRSKTWIIPAEKMKMGVEHHVPLPKQAIKILKDVQAMNGHGRYVFPSVRRDGRPMSDGAVNAALRGLGFAHDVQTGHGFRATARTILDEVLNQDVRHIEMQLSHEVKDALGAVYNRTKFLDQRRKMMNLWCDFLDSLRDNTKHTL